MFDREKPQSDAEFRSLAERFQRFAARQRAPGKLPRDPFAERDAAPEHAGAPPRLSDLFGGRAPAETPQQQTTGEPAAHERLDAGVAPETATRNEGGASASTAPETMSDPPLAPREAAEMHAPDAAGSNPIAFSIGDEPAAGEHPAQDLPPAGGEAAALWQPWEAEASAPWRWQADHDHDGEAWPHRAAELHAGDTPERPTRDDAAEGHDDTPARPAFWQNGTGGPRTSELYERETPLAPAPWHAEGTPQDRENGAPPMAWLSGDAEGAAGVPSLTYQDETDIEPAFLHAAPSADAPIASEAAATGPYASYAEARQSGYDDHSGTAPVGSAFDEYEEKHGTDAAPANAGLPAAAEGAAAASHEAPLATAPWSPPASDAQTTATEQPLFFTPPRRPQSVAEADSDPWGSAATPFAPPPARELHDVDGDTTDANAEDRPLSAWPATDGFRHNEPARPIRPPTAEEFISDETTGEAQAKTPADQRAAPGFAAFARRWQEEHRGEIARPLTLRTADEPEQPRGLFARLRGVLFGSGGAALGDAAVAFEPEEDATARKVSAPPAIPVPADEQPRERVASLRYSVMQREEEEEDSFATGFIARVKRSWFRETPDPLAIGAGLAIAIAIGLVLIGVLFRHGGKPEVQTSSSGPAVAETSAPATASAAASPISAFRAPTLAPIPSVTPLAIAPIARVAQATPVPPTATVPAPTTVPIQTPAPPPLTRPARTATFVPPQIAANNTNSGGSLPGLVGNASTSPGGTLSASAPPPAASAPVYTSGSGSTASGSTARYAPAPVSSGSGSSAGPAVAAAPPSPSDVGAALSDAAAAASRAAAAAAQRAGGGASTGR